MNDALVGYTGFVGGNLARSHSFNAQYNSKNIAEAFGNAPELLIYAGMRAEKYLANSDPDADFALVEEAFANIQKIAPKNLVLISTVDVYQFPMSVDENSPIQTEGLQAYGYHRYRLEQMVRNAYPEALIVRLPGLFGKGIKKNFIYDLMSVVPFMLKTEKYQELCKKCPLVAQAYVPAKTGFVQLSSQSKEQRAELKSFYMQNDFNALCFTDSRAVYQFYDLSRLWDDISAARLAGIKLLNLATEPVSAAEVYQAVRGQDFHNELAAPPVCYAMKSCHAEQLGGKSGYLCDKQEILSDICAFVKTTEQEGTL